MNIWAKLAPYSSIQYVGNTRKMFLWSNIINLKMTPRTLRKMLTKKNRDQKILAKWNIQQYWFLPCHICFWISPINSSLQPLSSWCRRRWWSNITSRWSSCPGRRRPTSIGSRRRWRRIVPVVPITSILLSSTSPWRLDLLWHQRLVLHVPCPQLPPGGGGGRVPRGWFWPQNVPGPADRPPPPDSATGGGGAPPPVPGGPSPNSAMKDKYSWSILLLPWAGGWPPNWSKPAPGLCCLQYKLSLHSYHLKEKYVNHKRKAIYFSQYQLISHPPLHYVVFQSI